MGVGKGNRRGIFMSNAREITGNNRSDRGCVRKKRPTLESDNEGGYEYLLETWEPVESAIPCPECKGAAVEKLREWSILDTYRCQAGHRWSRVKSDQAQLD